MKKTVQDPVCGMNIDPDKAREAGLFIETDGQTYYFCSEECANEFHRHGPQIETLNNPETMPAAISAGSACPHSLPSVIRGTNHDQPHY